MRVVVIGGGPAGMLAAISASQNGNQVILMEKNNILGKKLLITGKGRCNITSSLDMEEFIKNVPGNGRFLYSAFNNYTNEDIIAMLEKQGIKTKVERGNRVFPVSDKSLDVRDALEREIKKNRITIRLNAVVKEIITENNMVAGVKLESGEDIIADKVILATGGKSYPNTGSTGDGYKMAKKLGHTITEIKPSLVPLTTKATSLEICKQMQGLSLRNVGIKVEDIETRKIVYEDFGEMLFTHFGVSGPTILSSSAVILRYKNIEEKMKNNSIILNIDLKPALSYEKLDSRVQRDFEKYKNKEIRNAILELLPQKMILPVLKLSNIEEEKQTNSITREERQNLIKTLKEFKITISGFRPIEEAIITSGGISIKEINPKTMESKLVQGLYFAGEIIDVDAYTGGFNLQIAYSTGYTAGMNCC